MYNDRQRGRLQSDGEYVDIIDSSYKDDVGIRYDISGRLDGQGYLYFGKQGNATHANQGQAMERYDRNRLSLPMPKQKRTFSYEKPVTTSNVDQRKVIRNWLSYKETQFWDNKLFHTAHISMGFILVIHFDQFKPIQISHYYQLEQSTSNFWDVKWYYYFFQI